MTKLKVWNISFRSCMASLFSLALALVLFSLGGGGLGVNGSGVSVEDGESRIHAPRWSRLPSISLPSSLVLGAGEVSLWNRVLRFSGTAEVYGTGFVWSPGDGGVLSGSISASDCALIAAVSSGSDLSRSKFVGFEFKLGFDGGGFSEEAEVWSSSWQEMARPFRTSAMERGSVADAFMGGGAELSGWDDVVGFSAGDEGCGDIDEEARLPGGGDLALYLGPDLLCGLWALGLQLVD